jgi:hypothetical protein
MFTRYEKPGPAPRQARMFIRFGEGKALSLSMVLCSDIIKKGKRFDIWIDEKDRLIGFVPCEKGEYGFRQIPGCVGASDFVRKYKPLMMTRLPVFWKEAGYPSDKAPPGMWVASLDGDKLDMETIQGAK